MIKIILFLLIFMAIIFIAGCTKTSEQTIIKQSDNIIEIITTGFSPEILTIKVGETVTFVNKQSSPSWPASAVHPTHRSYPEQGGCIGSKFDACKGLKNGESWSFTFNQKGTWKYHDHLDPSKIGTIIVGEI